MKITEQATTYIQEAMKENNLDTIRFFGVPGCCGMNLAVALQPAEENDAVEMINGVQVAIQPDMKDQLNEVTLNTEETNGEIGLVLEGYHQSSCC